MRRIYFLSLFVLSLSLAPQLKGQNGPALGFDPYGSFQHSGLDHVNFGAANVLVDIPLFSLPQRGAFKPITFSIVANSAVWSAAQSCSDINTCTNSVLQTSVPYTQTWGAGIVSDGALPIEYDPAWAPFSDGTNLEEAYSASLADSTGTSHQIVPNWSDSAELRSVDGSGYRVIWASSDTYLNNDYYDQYEYNDETMLNHTTPPHYGPDIYDRAGKKTSTSVDPILGNAYYSQTTDLDGNTVQYPNLNFFLDESATTIDTIGRRIHPIYWGHTSEMNTSTAGSGCPDLGRVEQPLYGYTVHSFVDQWGTTTPDPRYTYTICYTAVGASTNFWSESGTRLPGTWPGGSGDGEGVMYFKEAMGGGFAIQSIVRPDGTYWAFLYDTTCSLSEGCPGGPKPFASGAITKVIEPTGGAIAYCYPSDRSSFYSFLANYDSAGDSYSISLPLLTTREEELVSDSSSDACGTTNPAWAYTISPDSGSGDSLTTATATDPTGNVTTYTFGRVGETNEKVYQGAATGTPLKETTRTYSLLPVPIAYGYGVPVATEPISGYLSTETTALNGTIVGNKTWNYGGTYYGNAFGCIIPANMPPYRSCSPRPVATMLNLGQLYNTATYQGSGSSHLLQSTTNTYLSDSSSTYFTTYNLLDLLTSVVVSDSTSSKETDYAYDESTYSSGGVKGHLTTTANLLGLQSHVYWTPSTRTSLSGLIDQVKDTKGTITSTNTYSTAGYPTGSPTYFAALQPTQVTGPLGNDTYSYDVTSGQVLSHQDINSQTTYIAYDNMFRPWTTTTPDTQSGYSQVACYPSVTQVILYQAQGNTGLTSSLSSGIAGGGACPSSTTAIVKTQNVDGLGRVKSTILNSAPEGATEVDTAYDSMERVYSVSNPFVIGSGPTVWTVSQYDALSRPLSVYEGSTSTSSPNGDLKAWSYSASTTTFTDEDSNKSQTAVDYLNRTIDVFEPTANNSTASMLHTNYVYNVYGLTTVNQYGNGSEAGRYRSFSYDSIGRLIQTNNPETGSINYTYPVSGSLCVGSLSLLCTKTDNRNVTTTYGYSIDGSYELLGETFSGSDSNSTAIASAAPANCYQYGAAGGSVPNGNGRLINAWTQTGGSCSSSPPANLSAGLMELRSIQGYDAMGRVTKEKQCTLSICSTTSPPVIAYNYDLAGKITSYNNGMQAGSTGAASFANQFDSAGRLLTVTSSWDDWTHPGLLFSAQSYSPSGLTNANLGNHLNLQRTYDPRLRISTENVVSH